ncbi:hypothetical protein [Cohnella sp.]|uniref:hypothetical protein n=1 Tax=Cohnella sp. TaxID=1883426 RepID=UPI0035628C6A
MEELKKAYEILGLPEDATREQVENRYFILLKRARSEQARIDAGDSTTAADLADVNRAYNLVLGIELEKTGTIEKQSKYAHFMYYYKFHLIVSIIIVLVAGYMIKENIDKRRIAANLPPASLSMSVFGNYYFADVEVLEQNMLKLIPEWKRIAMTHTYVPKEIKSEQDMAMQQKSILSLMTEQSNLYILDAKNFISLATQGALLNLDELEGWTPNVAPEKLWNAKSEEDTAPEPYGIDITGNPVFEGVELSGERQIIAVRVADENWNATRMLLDKLIQSSP